MKVNKKLFGKSKRGPSKKPIVFNSFEDVFTYITKTDKSNDDKKNT